MGETETMRESVSHHYGGRRTYIHIENKILIIQRDTSITSHRNAHTFQRHRIFELKKKIGITKWKLRCSSMFN